MQESDNHEQTAATPEADYDVEKLGYGWEGVCPCGCGGTGHHDDDHDHAHAHDHEHRHHDHDHDGAHGGEAPGAAGGAGVSADWPDAGDAGAGAGNVGDVWVDGSAGAADGAGLFGGAGNAGPQFAWPTDEADDDLIADSDPFAGMAAGSFPEDDEEQGELPEPALQESDFTYDGVRYHVRRWGDPADIPLLALHGFMQSGAAWQPVAKYLAHGHCAYAIDLAGHGQSDATRDPQAYTIDGQVAMLAAFIQQVMMPANKAAVEAAGTGRAQTHVHVVGYSMGGRIALELALQHPELVYTLVLESAGLGPADEEARAALAQRAAKWAADLREGGIEAFVDAWEQLPLFASQQRLPQTVRDAVRAERLANDAEAMALAVENGGQHTMQTNRQNRERLSYAWTPVLYICGTRDDKYLAQAEDLVHMGLDTKALMGGHNLHLEQPDAFGRALEDFYRKNELRGF